MQDETFTNQLTGQVWTRDRLRSGPGKSGVYVSSALEAAPVPSGRGGVETFAFSKDGKFKMIGPGPDNRPRTTTGTWVAAEEAEGAVKLILETADTKIQVHIKSDNFGVIIMKFETPE